MCMSCVHSVIRSQTWLPSTWDCAHCWILSTPHSVPVYTNNRYAGGMCTVQFSLLVKGTSTQLSRNYSFFLDQMRKHAETYIHAVANEKKITAVQCTCVSCHGNHLASNTTTNGELREEWQPLQTVR